MRWLSPVRRLADRGWVMLGGARSVLAGAQLTVLLFTPEQTLFFARGDLSGGVRCAGLRGVSLWCLGGDAEALPLSRLLAMAVLLAVMIGYRPRWTCGPHWYVAFSMASGMTIPNGGDQVAQITTMLLVPVCLGDRRTWHWTEPTAAVSAGWQGAASAALLLLRVQCAIIYVTAAVSKLTFVAWRDGSAIDSVASDPNFAMPDLVVALLSSGPGQVLSPLTTWTVVLGELLIGILVLGDRRMRRWALVMGVTLHLAIVVLLGLFSFGIVMIATLAAAAAEVRNRCYAGQEGQEWTLVSAGSRPPRRRPKTYATITSWYGLAAGWTVPMRRRRRSKPLSGAC
jgi:antimicrobial peptide system SdpB family protein